jgi:hypothetical protein
MNPTQVNLLELLIQPLKYVVGPLGTAASNGSKEILLCESRQAFDLLINGNGRNTHFARNSCKCRRKCNSEHRSQQS